MKILLISPASGCWRKVGRRKLFNGRTFRFSMLSLLTLVKLSPYDAQITLIDEQIDEVPPDTDFDLVGITCMTATAPRAFELADHYRKYNIPVVLGGFFPTLNPDLALQHCDAVVIGPAMDAWPKLLDDLRANRLQKRYCGNPAGQVPASLPRHLLDKSKYSTTYATYATMGCRNRCKFCSIGTLYKSQHYCRPIPDVIAEIRSFPSRFFMFVDDNLTQNREYILNLLKELAPLKKKWITQASIEIADDPDLLSALQTAGCVGLFIGLESFTQSVLTLTEKGFNVPFHYKKAVETIHRYGIFVEAGIIFGFDNDDIHIFQSTLDLLEDIGIDAVQVSILTSLPGTPLYEEFKPRITDSDWEHYDYRHVVFQPRLMSAAQLQAGTDWVIRRFYSPWRILRRTLRWLAAPGGLSNFIYPFVLNWAYFGRVISFKIKGYNPALQPLPFVPNPIAQKNLHPTFLS
ncbi:MAG TPA: radical SAM protein [Anaerohalosphaeraceae bacterium]|nr:radical SAM protein [Anaerohalosphaeraceae bacterium]